MNKKEKVELIKSYFDEILPNATCELNYSKDFELLIAVVLSAQTTDKKVNELTAKLFKKYPTIDDYDNASLIDIENSASGMTKRKDILKEIDKEIECTFYKDETDATEYYTNKMIRKRDYGGKYNEKFLETYAKNTIEEFADDIEDGVKDENI